MEEFFVYIIERIIVTFSSSVSIGLCFAPYAPVLCICLLLFLFDAPPVLSKVEMPCCSSFCVHLTQLICQLYSVSLGVAVAWSLLLSDCVLVQW